MLNVVIALFSLTECLARESILIFSIVPNTGPLTGNTRVIVRGTNLEPSDDYPHPLCKFGRKSNIVKGTYVTCTPLPRNPDDPEPKTIEKTSHCIECDPSPPSLEEDMVPFLVSITGDFSDVTNSVEFNYYTPPKIDRIVPIYGPKNGGTTVTVYGENFIDYDQYLRCFFGVKAVPGIYISPTLMHCVSPFSDTVRTAQPFKITLNDQQTTKDNTVYYYYPDPAIMKAIPYRVPMSGNVMLDIEGQYLDPFNDMLDIVDNHNDTFCMFANSIFTPAIVVSDAKVQCLAPPSQVARTIPIDVTINNADIALNPQDWTDDHIMIEYYKEPIIYSIEPNIVPNTGSFVITVNGNDFNSTSTIKCQFGNKVVNGKYIDPNHLECVSPPADNPGPINFSVSFDGENFSQPLRFNYLAQAEIATISPICGPRTGYTQITVTGKNFISTNPDNVKCVFGNLEFTQATIISETEIRCDSPDIHLKPYKQIFFNFTVSLNGDDRGKSSGPLPIFGYYDFHTISSISPDFGPLSGGTQSAIYGSLFNQKGVCNVTVRFGTVEVPVKSYNDTAIITVTPEMSVPGAAIVQISLNGQQFTDYDGPRNLGGSKQEETRALFNFYGPPLATGFTPFGGPCAGNSNIDIFGAGFGSEGEPVYIRFSHSSNHSVIAIVLSEDVDLNHISLLSPKAPPNTKAIIEVSRNGQNYVQVADYPYMFYASPTITSLDPNIGPVKNELGGNITVIGTDFICPTVGCEDLTCKYGTKPYPLFLRGYWKDSKHVLCPIIMYSRPEVITIEISMNSIDYTNNNVMYTFFDAFVLGINPRFIMAKGGAWVSVIGYGFANTGVDLKCRFGSADDPLLCNNAPCEFRAKYISDTEVQCEMPPASQITHKNTGEGIESQEFAIEISVKNNLYTNSDIQIRYVREPDFLSISPTSGSANGWNYITFDTNYHWEIQEKSFVMRYAEAKCRFYSKINSIIVDAGIVVYPLQNEGDPNALACMSPPWPMAETVNVGLTINGKDWVGGFTYKYTDKMVGKQIFPSCGPNSGETKITLMGSGFGDHPNLHLKWGTESRPAAHDSLFVDNASGSLTSYSPHTPTTNSHGGFVYVEIGVNIEISLNENSTYIMYDEYTNNKIQYFYYMEPTLDYLYPRGGSDKGGTIVTISGSWFINYEAVDCTPRCRFGDQVSPGEFINTVKIRCVAPPQVDFSKSYVDVDISFNGLDWPKNHLKFIYYHTPIIYSIFPLTGPSTGGTMIAVNGTNYTANAVPEEFLCRFSQSSNSTIKKYVPAIFKSEELIYCTLPGGWGSGSEVKIDLTFNGIDYTNSNVKFNIYQIDDVLPRSAPTEGSLLGITIHGSGFISNEKAACVINNVDIKATSVSWNKVVCMVPPSPEAMKFVGTVPLEVTVNGIDYQKYPRGFYYYNQPIVTDVTPLSGPVNGGSTLTVFGGPFKAGFEQARPTCAIGPFTSPAVIKSPNTIECVTPAMEKPRNGTALPVKIAINGQDYTNNTHTYSVYGLVDSAPKGGPHTGGTEVLIRGFGFVSLEPRCRFGIDSNNIVVEAKLIDDSHLICSVPSGFKIPTGTQLPLDIPLEIGFSDGRTHPWTRTDNKFRLYDNPKILSLSPTFGFIDLRYEVNIVAEAKKGFFPAITGWKSSNELDVMHSIVCRFGKYGDVPAVYVNKTNVRCVTPDTKILRKDIHEDTVQVSLALNGQDFIDIGSYTFKGSASGLWVVLMWLGLVVLIVAIVVLLALLISKYYDGSQPFLGRQEDDGRVSAASGPHVVRGHDGAIRPSSIQNPGGFS